MKLSFYITKTYRHTAGKQIVPQQSQETVLYPLAPRDSQFLWVPAITELRCTCHYLGIPCTYLSLYRSVFWSVVIDGEMWSVNLWTGTTSDDFTAQGNDLVPDKLNSLAIRHWSKCCCSVELWDVPWWADKCTKAAISVILLCGTFSCKQTSPALLQSFLMHQISFCYTV